MISKKLKISNERINVDHTLGRWDLQINYIWQQKHMKDDILVACYASANYYRWYCDCKTCLTTYRELEEFLDLFSEDLDDLGKV